MENKTDRELMYEHFQADLDFQKDVMKALNTITDKLDENNDSYILKRYVPILEAWEGLSFTNKLVIGGGAISAAIASIGTVIWWIFTHLTR